MKKRTFVVLGLGIFGSTICKNLVQNGFEVIAIDSDEESVERVAKYGADAYQADFTNIESLRAIGLEDIDIAIVATGSHLEDSVIAILNLKELGIPYILAKAKNKKYMEVLLKVGANRVIRPEKEMGERIAKQLTSPKIVDLFEIDDEFAIMEIKTPEQFVNKNVIQLDLRKKFNINVLGVRHHGTGRLDVNMGANYNFKADDIIVLIANKNFYNDLTKEQLADIYTGEIKNWSEVGGSDEPIVVIGREASSGTREAFESILELEECSYSNELDNTGAVIAKVSAVKGAIGYVSLDVIDDSVKALKMDGVEATAENIKNGTYFLQRPFVMGTKGEIEEQEDIIQAYFEFLQSDEGKAVIEQVGLITVD